MNKMFLKVILVILGFVLKGVHSLFKVNENKWIFGSLDGLGYADNSKYFHEYMLNEHPDINSIWLTRNKKTLKSMRNSGCKVFMNCSLVGIFHSLTAGVCVFSTTRSDLLYVFPRKNRRIVNLWHGMPMKKIVYDYKPHSIERKGWKAKVWDKYVVGFSHKDVCLIPATSQYFSDILKSAFRNDNVKVLGQPRTDVFLRWNKTEIKEKLGFAEDDFIVTYMPTHRAYGKGALNPRIFCDNEIAIKYFQTNNIKLVWKFHKNMLGSYLEDENLNADVFVDLTKMSVDPQELLFVTDILITDYSSCYIDYLLLQRPIIYYLYDNYEEVDNELYYRPNQYGVGMIAENEAEILESIKNSTVVKKDIVQYHEYQDGDSCSRVYSYIADQC